MFLQQHKSEHQIASAEEWRNWLTEKLCRDHLCFQCVKGRRSRYIWIPALHRTALSSLYQYCLCPSPSAALACSSQPRTAQQVKKPNTEVQNSFSDNREDRRIRRLARGSRRGTLNFRGWVLHIPPPGSVQRALGSFGPGKGIYAYSSDQVITTFQGREYMGCRMVPLNNNPSQALSKRIEEEETLLSSFSIANRTLIQNPNKDITKTENYRPTSLLNIDYNAYGSTSYQHLLDAMKAGTEIYNCRHLH